MMSLAWPWLFVLLPLPLVARWLPKGQHAVSALYMPTLLQVGDKNSQSVSLTSWIFLSVLWLLLLLAAARPQWLGDPVSVKAQAREMMFAVDLSGSMKEQDMILKDQPVNRLQMIKAVLTDFIERRKGDRLGLILFGDDAYLQTPMTEDQNTLSQMLNESVIGLVGDKTAIGDAIGLAAKRFSLKETSNRVLILLTDGQNTAGKLTPEEATELAMARDITIYTIGVGADEMLVNSIFGVRRVNPSADLDEPLLTQIAAKTGGQYFRARDTESLQQIYQLLDQLQPVNQQSLELRPKQELFFWPLALVFLGSIMKMAWPIRRAS